MTRAPDLTVHVDQAPEPGLLRPAIDAALHGRRWPPGAEARIAEAVRDTVVQATARRQEGAER